MTGGSKENHQSFSLEFDTILRLTATIQHLHSSLSVSHHPYQSTDIETAEYVGMPENETSSVHTWLWVVGRIPHSSGAFVLKWGLHCWSPMSTCGRRWQWLSFTTVWPVWQLSCLFRMVCASAEMIYVGWYVCIVVSTKTANQHLWWESW